MDLNFTPAEQEFREEVRTFLEEKLPKDLAESVLAGLHVSRDDIVRWQRILHRQGWGAPAWPKEYGGTGWGPVEQYIFESEATAAGAPLQLSFGLKMIGPVLMRFGNEAQKARFLPRIVSGEDWWSQGYSEPESGSDLASLRTRAERRGDHYVVNGQKTWITQAQYGDWIFVLVRTDPSAKPQAGISLLLVDMRSPGVEVRPIITLDGGHEVNEVWFEEVKAPVENLVGEENKGWTYAKFLLGHERTNIAGVGGSKRELARLKRIAAQERKRGRPLIEDPYFAARIAQVEIDLMALEITNLRVVSAEAQRRAPGPEASLLKIKGTEIQQAIAELIMQAVGPYAVPFVRRGPDQRCPHGGPPYAVPAGAAHCNARKTSIYGGSNEIQRSIISSMILGL